MKKSIIFAALLTTTWPDGTVQHSPCIDDRSCDLAAQLDMKRGATTAIIIRNLTPAEAGFLPGWDCIKGYNCK